MHGHSTEGSVRTLCVSSLMQPLCIRFMKVSFAGGSDFLSRRPIHAHLLIPLLIDGTALSRVHSYIILSLLLRSTSICTLVMQVTQKPPLRCMCTCGGPTKHPLAELFDSLSNTQDKVIAPPLSNHTHTYRPSISPQPSGDTECREASQGSGYRHHVLQVFARS